MYVTDVPVMDRLTDPTWRELWPAFSAVEDALLELINAVEDVPATVKHAHECGEDCADMATLQEDLRHAAEAADAAQERMAEALALAGIESAA